jgi:hypothetical protein
LKLDKDLAADILTGLNNKTYEPHADEPAKGDDDLQEWVDAVSEVADEHGYELVSAVTQYVKDSSEDVRSHELSDFLQEHYTGVSGRRVGDVLQEYAQGAEGAPLGALYNALDEAGGVDWFDWAKYADSGQVPLEGLAFIVVPTTGTANNVFLFRD